jgi:hypothetical protein
MRRLADKELPMSGTQRGWEVAALLLGVVGLFKGLSRLASSPLSGVLIILAAMAFVLFPAASLCGAEIRRLFHRSRSDEMHIRQSQD